PRNLERETGFEPATSTLARSHSTAELLPLSRFYCKQLIFLQQRRAQALINGTCFAFLRQRFVGFRRDLVSHIPQIFVEKMFHALMQDLDRRTHGAHNASPNDSLGEFQVVEAKQMDAFIEVEQALSHVMQPKEFLVAVIKIIHGEIRLVQLRMERFSKARTNVQQREETRRIEAAVMSQSRTDDLIIVRCDRFQNM